MKKASGTLLIIALVLMLCSCFSDSEDVMSVKNAYLRQYADNVTVGEAFDRFLGSPKWKSFTGEKGEKVVECNGNGAYMDNKVDISVQFIIKGDMFEVGAFTMNDIPQTDFMKDAFLTKVFQDAGGTVTSAQTSAPAEETPAATAAPAQQTAAMSSTLSDYSYVEDYLQEYKLDRDNFTIGDLSRFDQTQVRQLLNALYARYGYTFESEDNKRFFGRMPWYMSMGTSMEQCEAQFNLNERGVKEMIVMYEKEMGWR